MNIVLFSKFGWNKSPSQPLQMVERTKSEELQQQQKKKKTVGLHASPFELHSRPVTRDVKAACFYQNASDFQEGIPQNEGGKKGA